MAKAVGRCSLDTRYHGSTTGIVTCATLANSALWENCITPARQTTTRFWWANQQESVFTSKIRREGHRADLMVNNNQSTNESKFLISCKNEFISQKWSWKRSKKSHARRYSAFMWALERTFRTNSDHFILCQRFRRFIWIFLIIQTNSFNFIFWRKWGLDILAGNSISRPLKSILMILINGAKYVAALRECIVEEQDPVLNWVGELTTVDLLHSTSKIETQSFQIFPI